mmetsp:Transcript_13824/g.23034  ORF Transcript_13824/g.23034 Transcript_13824/m.23034 type:complete len:131 (-) Transcript_13824:1088-1480(-)
MVQGSMKKSAGRPGSVHKSTKSAKLMKKVMKTKQAKKGNPLQLPKGKYRDEALDDRALSKAINKASEQKVAAKLIQDGSKLQSTDLMQKGKELSREQRRAQVKKKVGRVEQKLNELKARSEMDGLKERDR